MAHRVDWTELIWGLVEKEMVDLAQGTRTDWAYYYGAYLHRLIWVERPDIFRPPLAEIPPELEPAPWHPE